MQLITKILCNEFLVINTAIGQLSSVYIGLVRWFLPFLLREHWRPFVSGDFGVIVDSNNQFVTESFGLSESIGVSKMHHVVAEIETRKKTFLTCVQFMLEFADKLLTSAACLLINSFLCKVASSFGAETKWRLWRHCVSDRRCSSFHWRPKQKKIAWRPTRQEYKSVLYFTPLTKVDNT